MKTTRKITLCLLAVLIVTTLLITSCASDKDKNQTTAGGSESSSESAGGENSGETTQIPSGIPDKKYDGYIIRIVTANEAGNGIDVGVTSEETTEQVNAAVYKRDRAVEDLLDVKLSVKAFESYGDAYISVKTALDAASDEYELCFLQTTGAFQIAAEGKFVDLNGYGCIDLDMPWWDNKVNTAHMIDNKLFTASGAISVNDLLRTHMLLFNSNLFDNKNMEYPYQMVLDGTWTIDKLYEYASTLNDDVNGDSEYKMEDDVFGLSTYSWCSAYTLWYGCGGTVISKDNDGYPSVDINGETVSNIYDKMYKTIVLSGSNLVSDGGKYFDLYKSFTDGRVFITEACMMHLTHWETFRDMKDDYGIIPSPKYDEGQKDYISYAEVVQPTVSVPLTVTAGDDMISAVIEAMAYEAYYTVTPAVYETALKERFARDETSKKMLDIISENRISCLGSVFIPQTSLVSSLPGLLSGGTSSVSSYIARFETAMITSLEKAIEKFR